MAPISLIAGQSGFRKYAEKVVQHFSDKLSFKMAISRLTNRQTSLQNLSCGFTKSSRGQNTLIGLYNPKKSYGLPKVRKR